MKDHEASTYEGPRKNEEEQKRRKIGNQAAKIRELGAADHAAFTNSSVRTAARFASYNLL